MGGSHKVTILRCIHRIEKLALFRSLKYCKLPLLQQQLQPTQILIS